jgi:hypothetical protein
MLRDGIATNLFDPDVSFWLMLMQRAGVTVASQPFAIMTEPPAPSLAASPPPFFCKLEAAPGSAAPISKMGQPPAFVLDDGYA